jgi:hypothetical protein
MKKLIFSVLSITFCITTLSAKVIITKENGSANDKYYYVNEGHDGNNHVLSCKDPGNSKCAFLLPTMVKGTGSYINSDIIVAWVESQVNSSIPNGTGVEYSSTGIHVTWTFDDVTDKLVIEITDCDGN